MSPFPLRKMNLRRLKPLALKFRFPRLHPWTKSPRFTAAKINPNWLIIALIVFSLIFYSLPRSTGVKTEKKVLGANQSRVEVVFHNPKSAIGPTPIETQPTQATNPPTQTNPSPQTKTLPKTQSKPAAKPITQTWEDQLVSLTNQARVANGLSPLQLDSRLTNLARIRSTDMATNNYFDHTSPTGETAVTLLNLSGIAYKAYGENIGNGTYGDSQIVSVVFNSWMASSGHKANILSPKYSSIGIGAAVASSGKKYFTQIFIGS